MKTPKRARPLETETALRLPPWVRIGLLAARIRKLKARTASLELRVSRLRSGLT